MDDLTNRAVPIAIAHGETIYARPSAVAGPDHVIDVGMEIHNVEAFSL